MVRCPWSVVMKGVPPEVGCFHQCPPTVGTSIMAGFCGNRKQISTVTDRNSAEVARTPPRRAGDVSPLIHRIPMQYTAAIQ